MWSPPRGKGTTFRIFLPRHVAGVEEAPAAAPRLHCRKRRRAGDRRRAAAATEEVKRAASADLTGEGTILLVEDEEGLRALNARGLASRGYTVLEAGNGIEAIDVLEKSNGQVDLVVSDVVMPEMDGPTLGARAAHPQSRPEDHLRLRLCRGRVREASARSRQGHTASCPSRSR